MVKITPTIRRLLTDPDYYRAMQQLLGAQEELKTITRRPSYSADNVSEYVAPITTKYRKARSYLNGDISHE